MHREQRGGPRVEAGADDSLLFSGREGSGQPPTEPGGSSKHQGCWL